MAAVAAIATAGLGRASGELTRRLDRVEDDIRAASQNFQELSQRPLIPEDFIENFFTGVSFDNPIERTVNVTGETLVLYKIFPGFMLGTSLLYAGTNPIFPTFPA